MSLHPATLYPDRGFCNAVCNCKITTIFFNSQILEYFFEDFKKIVYIHLPQPIGPGTRLNNA